MQQAHRTSSHPELIRPIIAAWQLSDAELNLARRYVTIDTDRIPELLRWIAPGTPSTAWRSYVSPVDDAAPDLARLYYELALTISQFGGFVERGISGGIQRWQLDSSGVTALLKTMSLIRTVQLLPGLDIHDRVREQLSCYFMGSTFAKQRTEMMCELASKGGLAFFQRHLDTARRPDGSYCFNVLHMAGLANSFPLSFGGDAPFYKKASLLLLTMAIALNQLGHRSTALTLPPADYRIPQIFEALGVLRCSPDLVSKLDRKHLFSHSDPEVRAIRGMTVEATGHVRDAYERTYGTKLSIGELDGMLYLLSRNQHLQKSVRLRPHIMVATLAF